jgi:inositol 1,4,5-triphosphate receptor type 1
MSSNNFFHLIAKSRGIAIPSDLETQVASLFNKAAMLSRQTSKWLQAAKTPKIERSQSQVGYMLIEKDV